MILEQIQGALAGYGIKPTTIQTVEAMFAFTPEMVQDVICIEVPWSSSVFWVSFVQGSNGCGINLKDWVFFPTLFEVPQKPLTLEENAQRIIVALWYDFCQTKLGYEPYAKDYFTRDPERGITLLVPVLVGISQGEGENLYHWRQCLKFGLVGQDLDRELKTHPWFKVLGSR